MSKQKIIIWTTGIDDLIESNGQVGGLIVQMMHWAFAFQKENFKVYSFTKGSNRKFKGLYFLKMSRKKRLSIVFETINSIYYIVKVRPEIILFRGASRNLYIVSKICALFKVKLVFMGASDVNFTLGKENVSGRSYNKKLYRKGLKNTQYFAVQNKMQADNLFKNYNKESICIPNIWQEKSNAVDTKELIIWVGNFRSLKRPYWFVNLSKKISTEQFTMAGFPVNKKLYAACSDHSNRISNLDFLGPISFQESEALFDRAKLLICTSEYEGFPNTFLQAWSRNIPVISTVDPSNLIAENNLGCFVESEDELSNKLQVLMKNEKLFSKMEASIAEYFRDNHNQEAYLNRLLKYIE
ncbi:glycosyltransferase [Winogradskyella bathintestinalis]|uniref:Glycosyltransferase n=1 Tax=Winogradskyella bathintestinalis TaxID=3035208 RepID=A0ABT7ZSP7_9FLAO|nr:glycosyltransferase [Winogradskyella bathintestinalis]MDN3492049.1 glycosyltransferase [Winogradskyella bathintestinalis]